MLNVYSAATHSIGAYEAISMAVWWKSACFATVAVLFIPASVAKGEVTVFGCIWVYCYGFGARFCIYICYPFAGYYCTPDIVLMRCQDLLCIGRLVLKADKVTCTMHIHFVGTFAQKYTKICANYPYIKVNWVNGEVYSCPNNDCAN